MEIRNENRAVKQLWIALGVFLMVIFCYQGIHIYQHRSPQIAFNNTIGQSGQVSRIKTITNDDAAYVFYRHFEDGEVITGMDGRRYLHFRVAVFEKGLFAWRMDDPFRKKMLRKNLDAVEVAGPDKKSLMFGAYGPSIDHVKAGGYTIETFKHKDYTLWYTYIPKRKIVYPEYVKR